MAHVFEGQRVVRNPCAAGQQTLGPRSRGRSRQPHRAGRAILDVVSLSPGAPPTTLPPLPPPIDSHLDSWAADESQTVAAAPRDGGRIG